MSKEEKIKVGDVPTERPKPQEVTYRLAAWASTLPGGLITIGKDGFAVTLRPEGWEGAATASPDDMKFLHISGNPFVEKA